MSESARERLFALLHPAFRECCDDEVGRYDLTAPFVQGDYVYATDGRAIVRCPATPEVVAAAGAVPCDPSSRRIRDVAAVYGGAEFCPAPVNLPDVSGMPRCAYCRGSGVQGPYVCGECGHEQYRDGPCPECYGYRRGRGVMHANEITPGVLLCDRFVLFLVQHGAAVYPPLRPDGKTAVRFTLPGGVEGRVMPMTNDPV